MDDLFFIASKIAWGLLSPGNLLILLFAAGTIALLLKKIVLAKWILLPTSCIALALTAYPISDALMVPLEKRFAKPAELPKHIDGIILLGGGEDLKRSLSWHTQELGYGGDRYAATLKLARRYPQAPVIFTGGSGLMQLQPESRDQSEGHLSSTLLTDMGIAKTRLIIEAKSRNTYENFKNIKSLLPKKDGQYLLVTSAFHMPRSVGIARKRGIGVIPYPVDYYSNRSPYRQWDFDFYDHLRILESAWKEWIGLSVYFFSGKTSQWFPSPLNHKKHQPSEAS
ncbi:MULTISPECIES: YdcF family protein [Thiomicrorhabdus]|uniref:YdcF family protein n=1 Tax=Thiomicrorhabdus heinhorstiae TaxID=2748010 RepID=A0ABS0BWN7_9GAMM|nr:MULTISPECIES: YdcF family protein [Thiomicrorhabdus]MBF6058218.1 YdcF family protein [Thiomicrorhabdus heinhorstiae]